MGKQLAPSAVSPLVALLFGPFLCMLLHSTGDGQKLLARLLRDIPLLQRLRDASCSWICTAIQTGKRLQSSPP